MTLAFSASAKFEDAERSFCAISDLLLVVGFSDPKQRG
jgi:hypothetical protein